ncbi:SusC/RagA family TonB-linked outer membrane protein [Epilithonimonas xixisoli]|uniref:TonB-linked SusC/RagA family outer membrane protein n=1 Tax=Epilithonimonas xixisoli TaxID=1476462 RepID=A0A4R8I9G2_9FLAO|nr:SusC/RagA family TonB-linked outer membrane protein [Epilithonimonas xixisoli]TDX86728.1 TonB-linked SusC/RagA family outer membrane protein [Epilithonimonas xixisoli]
MNRFNFAKNKAAIFFAMALLPTTLAYSQSTNDTVVANESKIDEVVVIGYGKQRKEAVTGSVVSVKGDVMREVPSANISQALQGRAAGVDIAQTSSKPGAPMQIRIRGTRSLTGNNDPLIVLDGIPFPGSLADISPNDIQSLDILKDASATAIYGSRGANGVILITSKTGRKRQKATFSYNTFTGVSKIFSEYPMMSADKFIKLRADANLFVQPGVDESNDINTDWQDLLYKKGITTNHDVGISGGTEKGSYNFGFSYYNEKSVLPGQGFERLNVRGSLDQDLGKYFKIGMSTNNAYTVNKGSNLGIYNALSSTPISNPYNADGTLKERVIMSADTQYVTTRASLDRLGDAWIDKALSFSSYNNFFGEFNIPWVKGLKLRSNVGLNFKTTNTGNYTGEGVFSSEPNNLSSASIGNSLTTHWVNENILTYDRTFADKHKVNVVALQSQEQTKFNSSYITARDIPTDAFQFYNLGHAEGEITINPDQQGYYIAGLKSWMGRVMYEYDGRYMFSATIRGDGSSRLAPGYQWNIYNAFSAGWNVANEAFLKDSQYVNNLKLRFGYGGTANQAVSPYTTLGQLSTTPYNFGSAYAMGYYVSRLPNPKLGWENSETFNYGLDFGLFNNRVTGTFEYYVTNTKDLLLDVNLPFTSGADRTLSNVGSTQNKGFEFSLNGSIINGQDFSWDAGFNISANRNKITSLASGATRDESNWWFVGHSINSIFDYQYEGLWQNGDPNLNTLEPGGNVGMIKVLYTGGYNADGTPVRAIGPADRQIINTDPDFVGGFNTRLAYKNWDLSMVGAFRSGGVLISTLYGNTSYLNMLSGRRNNVDVDYWTEENPNVRYPKPGGIQSSNNPKYGSTLALFDASYLKIRTITVGYNFDQEVFKKAGITRLRVYATVTNPFVFFSPYHDESGMDPETNSLGNENQAVNDVYKSRFLTIGTNTPSIRNYMIGLNLTF